MLCLFVFSATVPSGLGPPRSRGFQITHNEAPQSLGLLWTSDQLVAEPSTWQHITLTTDRHPRPGGIRTHNLSRRAAANLRLRPRGHWDRQLCYISFSFLRNSPQWAMVSSFTRFLHHTQWRTIVGRTPLDEWSARHTDLCLTTPNTTDKHPCPPPPTRPLGPAIMLYCYIKITRMVSENYEALISVFFSVYLLLQQWYDQNLVSLDLSQ